MPRFPGVFFRYMVASGYFYSFCIRVGILSGFQVCPSANDFLMISASCSSAEQIPKLLGTDMKSNESTRAQISETSKLHVDHSRLLDDDGKKAANVWALKRLAREYILKSLVPRS